MEKVKVFLNKIKNFILKNKKIAIIVCAVVLVAIVACIIGISASDSKTKDNKEELTKLLEEMGKEFYEEYLYDSLTESDKQSFLERISVTGLKLDLDNLGRYDGKKNVENLKKFVNEKTDKECSKTNTYITIYANAPYGKNDYTIETNLDCGFEEK